MNEYYCVFLFQRKKDIPTLRRSTICVFQDLGKLSQIVERRAIYERLGKELNARVYISISPRDIKKTRRDMIHRLVDTVHADNDPSNIQSQLFSSLMRSPLREKKRFMLDIDTKNPIVLENIKEMIPEGHYITELETKNGFHVIVKPFDIRGMVRIIAESEAAVEIKKDAMTDIAYLDYLVTENDG